MKTMFGRSAPADRAEREVSPAAAAPSEPISEPMNCLRSPIAMSVTPVHAGGRCYAYCSVVDGHRIVAGLAHFDDAQRLERAALGRRLDAGLLHQLAQHLGGLR